MRIRSHLGFRCAFAVVGRGNNYTYSCDLGVKRVNDCLIKSKQLCYKNQWRQDVNFAVEEEHPRLFGPSTLHPILVTT